MAASKSVEHFGSNYPSLSSIVVGEEFPIGVVLNVITSYIVVEPFKNVPKTIFEIVGLANVATGMTRSSFNIFKSSLEIPYFLSLDVVSNGDCPSLRWDLGI